MTDQEITEIIAMKVMGWTIHKDWGFVDQYGVIVKNWFGPLICDQDCMMAWDEYQKNHINRIVSPAFKEEWWLKLTRMFIYKTGEDRRRAICQCIVEGIK